DKPSRFLGDQIGGDISGYPENEIEHAGRQARIVKRLDNVNGASRRLFCCFYDDGTSGGECAGDFASRLAHRKIPGRKGCNHPNRLVQYDVAYARLARYDPPIGTLPLRRIPFKELTAPDYFEPRLGDGLAMFECDCVGDLFDALAHECRGPQD